MGVALANSEARLSSPFITLIQSDHIYQDVSELVTSEGIDVVVIGLPKNLSGEDTDQTRYVRKFTEELKSKLTVQTYFEDEALSSVRAKKTLEEQGKPYEKDEIDSMAACFILDDFMANNPGVVNG